MKKLSLLLLIIGLFTSAFKWHYPTTKNTVGKISEVDTGKIALTIKLNGTTNVVHDKDFFVQVAIRNLTGRLIRVPDLLANGIANLQLSITEEPGRTLIPIRVAMVDLTPAPFSKYITLAVDGSYITAIDVNRLLKGKNRGLWGGNYQLQLVYINSKGENCVQGTYYSNSINIVVPMPTVSLTLTVKPATPTTSVVSNVVSFTAIKDTTPPKPFQKRTKSKNKTGKFTDERDEQTYSWVQIGKQIWMSENLNYKSKSGISYYPDGDSTNSRKFGRYYSFAALSDACPKGWHVPTDIEWQQMEIAAGLSPATVGKGTRDGDDISTFLPNGTSGFNVLYAGVKRTKLEHVDERAYFWAAEADNNPQYIYRRIFMKDMNQLWRATQGTAFALSLRCVKDDK